MYVEFLRACNWVPMIPKGASVGGFPRREREDLAVLFVFPLQEEKLKFLLI